MTDHKPLTTILGAKSEIPTLAAARLQRWAIILSTYKYKLEFRCSAEHGNVKALSRLPVSSQKVSETGAKSAHLFNVRKLDSLPVTSKQIAQATRKDPVLSKVALYTWPQECHDRVEALLCQETRTYR